MILLLWCACLAGQPAQLLGEHVHAVNALFAIGVLS